VEQVTAVPVGEGRLQIGMGARAAAVTRTSSPYLEKQIQKETGALGFQDGRADKLARVEEVFNEQQNKGLNQYITDFFNAFRELSNSPESVTTRTMVKEAGIALSNDFARVDKQLTDVQKDIDENIKNQLTEVNKMVHEVASLNDKIMQVENTGAHANDERDRRDLLIKNLNELIDIKYGENDVGMVNITTAGNAILVSGLDSYGMSTFRNPETDRLEIYYKPNESTPAFSVTKRIKGGKIGGALDVRDNTIVDLKNKVSNIAVSLASEVNSAHSIGFDKQGQAGGAFFTIQPQDTKTSAEIKVSEEILDDVGRIAAAARPGGAIGDNVVANVISQMQFRGVMDSGTTTIDDFYNSQVGTIGVIAQRANKTKESQQHMVNQLSSIRESIAGVSLDEETAKMIEFQKAFDASARVIRTADEMFDTILSLKRM
jgi:flagellar hook-associated protein 1 FlgK